ncbi:MAG: hypothetical protein QXF45_04410 [Candidatus Caldarchaeum sp.]
MRFVPLVGVVVLLIIGLFGFVESQQVITTTTTRVVTIPPTTYTTQTAIAGTTIVATITMPGYTLILEVYEPDQTCTITFTALPPPTAITIPGVTTTFPGTTISTVFTIREISTAFTSVVGGTTATRTDFRPMTLTMNGYAVPMMIYGAIRENCNIVTVTEIIRYIADSVPATIVIANPGITLSFEGTTVTGIEIPFTRLTTIFTEIRGGTTYMFSSRVSPMSYVTIQVVTPTTVMQTVIVPGGVRTETITTLITLQQTTSTTPQTPTTPITIITMPQPQTTRAPAGPPVLELLIPVAVIVVLVAVLLFSLRLRR